MSNYEKAKHAAAAAFLRYDQAEMARRFALAGDGDFLYIRFLGRTYRIGRQDGAVQGEAADGRFTEAGFDETMTIYDVLCGAKEDCRLAGEYINFQSLSAVRNGSVGGEIGGGMFQAAVRSFDHREAALALACQRLGGTPWDTGDVCFRIPMFDFFPVLFRFWSSDDEFPPSANILFDRNAGQFMRYETMWYAASHLLRRIREEMDGAAT